MTTRALRRRTWVQLLAVAVMGFLWAGGAMLPDAAAAQDNVVKIGLALDFTRVYTFAIEDINQGHRDYLELVNNAGGS